ncbi:MAG: DoxX family membrane protein [DPANN group archaeon]|nr:DoxX family membrane protein [DPANN group archaeon]
MKRIKPDHYKRFAPAILRIGLALVFLWFGISQLVNPASFIGYVPQWIAPHGHSIVHEHPFQFIHDVPIPSVHILLMANGVLETLFGLLLLLGFWTRISAAILALHLFGIAISLGYNDIMIRDLGLVLALVSVFLAGPDPWCLDSRVRRDAAAASRGTAP